MTRLALLLATCANIGRIPFAPGTFGSVPGLLLWWLCRSTGIELIEGMVIIIVFWVGAWAATVTERYYGVKDPGVIVIDEVLGMMVTLAFVPVGPWGILLGFLIFRFMDVVKPFPARMMENLPDGFGVIADDFVAGIWGNLLMRLLVFWFPVWLTE